MALSVDFIGRRLTNAESTTDFVTARVDGGGGQSWGNIALNSAENIQGTNCVSAESTANSNSKVVFFGFDEENSTGIPLDFTSGGSEENQLVWIWAKMIAPQPSGSYATLPGLSVGLSSVGAGSSPTDQDTAWWTFYGIENYPGSWVRMVVDPAKDLPTGSGVSFDLSLVSHVGIVGTTQTAKGSVEVAFIDSIDIGSGINVYGTTDTSNGFFELFNESESSDNKFGVFQSLETTNTVFGIQGYINLGDGTGVNNLAFSGENTVLAFTTPQYQSNSDGSLINAIPDDFQKINIKGNSTGTTDIDFGIKVDGATADDDTGRNGIIFLGNDLYQCDFVFNGGNVDSLNLYGCTLRNFQPTGGLNWDAESNNDLVGSFIDNCSQLSPDSGVRIRNCTFLNHPSGLAEGGSGDAALFFRTSPPDTEVTDIKNSSFVSNFYAIEHADSGTYTYTNLVFSDNTADIDYSNTSLGNLIIQATAGSDPTTAVTGNASNTVEIQNTVTLTITGIKGDGVGEKPSEVRIFSAGTKNELAGSENVITGEFEFGYQGGAGNVDIRVFNLDYQPLNIFDFPLPVTNSDLPIQQIFDRNYLNP